MPTERLLIVDDELFIRELLQEYFVKLGCSVDTASGGPEALQFLARRNYDVALIDVKMPEVSGLELLQQMRARGERLPSILMTGYPTVDSAVSALREGAVDYVLKPFRLNELSTIVKRAVKQNSHDRQALKEKIRILEEENQILRLRESLPSEAVRRHHLRVNRIPDRCYDGKTPGGEQIFPITDEENFIERESALVGDTVAGND